MKKILRRLIRGSITKVLLERKSDESYYKAVKFFSDILTTENFYCYHLTADETENLEEKYGYDPETAPLINDVMLINEENIDHDIYQYFIKSEKIPELWEKYKSQVKPDIFFFFFDNFKKYIYRFNILIMHSPEESGTQGSMSRGGLMKLYLGDQVNEKDKNTMLEFIKSNNLVYDTFVHEGTHYLNVIRSEGLSFGNTKKKDYTYTDDLEEMQARYIQATNTFNLETVDSSPEKYDLFLDLYNNEVRRFILAFIKIFYEVPLHWHKRKTQNRLIGRIYNFSQQVLESQEFKDFKEELDNEESIETIEL